MPHIRELTPHTQHTLNRLQQHPLLFISLLRELTQAKVDCTPAASQQAQDKPTQRELSPPIFRLIGPRAIHRPMPAQHKGVGQRLIEAFPPASPSNVQPELNTDRPIAEQERVGRCQ